jgi:protein phosphatase
MIARKQGSTRMGTTLTAAWLFARRAAWVHVGDSRLYVLSNGKLRRVTTDQTGNEFARRDAKTPISDGDRLAQNFIYGSRGLGDDARLRLDAGVDSGTLDLGPEDRLLLCTDGITSVLDDTTIAAALRDTDIDAAPRRLLDAALEKQSRDNVTAIVVG